MSTPYDLARCIERWCAHFMFPERVAHLLWLSTPSLSTTLLSDVHAHLAGFDAAVIVFNYATIVTHTITTKQPTHNIYCT